MNLLEKFRYFFEKFNVEIRIRFGAFLISLLPLFFEIAWTYFRGSPDSWRSVHIEYIETGRILFISVTLTTITALNIWLKKKRFSEEIPEKLERVAQFIKKRCFIPGLLSGGLAYILLRIMTLERAYYLRGMVFIPVAVFTLIFTVLVLFSVTLINSCCDW